MTSTKCGDTSKYFVPEIWSKKLLQEFYNSTSFSDEWRERMARQREEVERYAEMTVAYFQAKYYRASWAALYHSEEITIRVEFGMPNGENQLVEKKIDVYALHTTIPTEEIFKDLVNTMDHSITSAISSAFNGADLSGRASQVQQQPYATSARVAPEPTASALQRCREQQLNNLQRAWMRSLWNWKEECSPLPCPTQSLRAEKQNTSRNFLLALGEVKRNGEVIGGHPRSAHKVGLAAHLIVYTLDYKWPHPDEELIYRQLHKRWEELGGAPLIEGDLNHFSYEWEGVK